MRVDFTIDLPPGKLKSLREFMSCETNQALADAFRAEAEEYLLEYIDSNTDATAEVVRRLGVPV